MAQWTAIVVERRPWLIGGVVLLALGVLAAVAANGYAQGQGQAPGPKKEFHVAPWGDDSWNGTAGRPFATLQRAQQSVRANTPGMKRDIIVNLHPGTHTLAAPLRLRSDAGDSGQNGNRVIYQAYRYGTKHQEPVVLSGGRQITGWELDDADRNIWRAEVGDLDTRQLYVDGERATRPRIGERDPGPVFGSRPGGGLPGNVVDTPDGYVTDSVEPQSWENPEDIELIYLGPSFLHTYSEPRCGVADIAGTPAETRITMEQPCHRWFTRNHSGVWEIFTFVPGRPTHVENSKTFLTEPGTFYLDRSEPGSHVLYYIPRPDEDLASADVVAPALEELVSGEGEPDAPLHDVTFRGITFSHATWMGPSEPTGFSQVFGPMYEGGDEGQDPVDPWDVSDEARMVPGSIRFHHAERIVIEDNRFTSLGSDALEIAVGSSDNVIRGNAITDISGGGIQVGTRRPDPDAEVAEINPGNVIENNLVHDIGVEYKGSVGIYAEKTQGATIAHNQVNDVPYTALVFGEYWTDYPEGETTALGNRILNNRLFDTLSALNDGGGIWTAAPQGVSFEEGSLVRGNLTHDNVGAPGFGFTGGIGLFADDGSSFIRFHDNVTYHNGLEAVGGCQPVGPLIFTHNYLDKDEDGWHCFGEADVVFEDNTLLEGDPEEACAAIPRCAEIVANAGLEPRYRGLLTE